MHVNPIYAGQMALASTLRLKARAALGAPQAGGLATRLKSAMAFLTKYR